MDKKIKLSKAFKWLTSFKLVKSVVILFFLVLLLIPVLVVLGQYSGASLRSYAGLRSALIYAPGESYGCYVDNTSNLDYFVPLNTENEWMAFKSAATESAVSGINNLRVTCPCLTCSNRLGLAAANDGLNCGVNLNDGCGGTITCLSCDSGQVCNSGYPDSDCSIINTEGCVTPNNQQGYCANDNGCNVVIDVNGVYERGRTHCIGDPEALSCPTEAGLISAMNKVYSIDGACSLSSGTPCWNYAGVNDKMKVSIDGWNVLLHHWAYYSGALGKFVVESCTGAEPDPSEPGGPSQPVEPPPPLEVY